MGARRGRPRTRPRLGRLRGARAFLYRRRVPSLVVQHEVSFVVALSRLQIYRFTGTGTCTGEVYRVFHLRVSVVVQSGEHHEQHGAVVIGQDARAGAETISHVLVARRQARFPPLLFRERTQRVRVLVRPFTQRTRRLQRLSRARVAVRRALARRSGGGANVERRDDGRGRLRSRRSRFVQNHRRTVSHPVFHPRRGGY